MGLEVDSSGSKNEARVEGVDAEPGAVLHSGEENRRIVGMSMQKCCLCGRNIF